ncbi:MAG: hypothetical protein E7020_06105 [Alphaproteobacteria bacterium]|nr:hypothetical protein [Alphaproteobacteria bacterium]
MLSLSKEEKLNIIEGMMFSHSTLCPKLFNEQKQLRQEVYDKIHCVVDIVSEQSISCFPNITIKDITLNGSLCSYMYNDNSDLDLWIIIESIFPDDKCTSEYILGGITSYINMMSFKPSFYGHSLDFGILHSDAKYVHNHNSYSWLHNCWKNEPVRQEFIFTPQELYCEYCKYNKKLHDYAASLEKINNSFLTEKSIKQLQNYIFSLNEKAFQAKLYSPEHEYSLEYNLFRLLKKFGTWSFFRNYIDDSYQNFLRRNNG